MESEEVTISVRIQRADEDRLWALKKRTGVTVGLLAKEAIRRFLDDAENQHFRVSVSVTSEDRTS